MKFDHYKKFINVALDLLLGLLAIVVVIFMLRYIIDIGSLILRPLSADLFGKVLHDRGTETLLLTLAILVLAGVLTVFSFVSGDFKHSRGEQDIDIDQHF